MESNQASESQDQVSRDIIYSKMSDKAIRHRNYEKEIATWYTTILIAMLGFVLSSKFGTPTSGIAQLLSKNTWGQRILAVIVLVMAFSSCYSILFFHIQHTRLDEYVDALLGPEEEDRMKTGIKKKMPKLKPSHLMIVTQIVIAVGTVVLIFLKP